MRAMFKAAGVILAAGLAGCSSATQAVIDAGLAQSEAGIKPLKGLLRRRFAEAELFLT